MDVTPKLKPEIKARWIEALRSGKYKQAQGNLRRGDAFCCLGVLCDLAAQDGLGAWQRNIFEVPGESSNADLPNKIVEWAFGDIELPKHIWPRNPIVEAGSLAGLNDHGTKFDILADVITREL